MPYTFRTATSSDAPALSRLLKAAMLTYCANSGISSAMLEAMNEDIAAIEDRIRHCTCLCCMNGDDIVGLAFVHVIVQLLIIHDNTSLGTGVTNAGDNFVL